MMTPKQLYQQKLDAHELRPDTQQQIAIDELQRIYLALVKKYNAQKNMLGRLITQIKGHKPIKGLYMWGSVGVGKTLLMDLFYKCLPTPKYRIHFHAFMRRVHQELKTVEGRKNPLSLLAKKLADETMVLCFDEFLVNDIADAMLLAGLFEHLFMEGVTLITSANLAPDDLYKDGLQRELFLPAIKSIKENTNVLAMNHVHDYRLDHTRNSNAYFHPANKAASEHLEHWFVRLNQNKNSSTEPVCVLERDIKVIKRGDKVIWFNFFAICDVPRSQQDYLALAEQYQFILVSDIPVIQSHQDSLITAFINLIDVCYDAKIKLIMSGATDVSGLYPAGKMHFAYARTVSRLMEMQSDDY